ncbi:hypothetical protein [Bradyrhizobium oligotrophicum]|uniref:hypothetical protein n=1 Tax=Bradyrhizobium oligotrophicum TaxID=44255 RepID=UPI0011818319|nr:hypothetical protein [Bradyrhizobium oligotrophicum]
MRSILVAVGGRANGLIVPVLFQIVNTPRTPSVHGAIRTEKAKSAQGSKVLTLRQAMMSGVI